jgi:hypothetical protein
MPPEKLIAMPSLFPTPSGDRFAQAPIFVILAQRNLLSFCTAQGDKIPLRENDKGTVPGYRVQPGVGKKRQ